MNELKTVNSVTYNSLDLNYYYCVGMLDFVNVHNLNNIINKIYHFQFKLSFKHWNNLIIILIEKIYKLEMYEIVISLFEKLKVSELPCINDDDTIYNLIRSFYNCNKYNEIIKLSKTINISTIKSNKETVIINIARSYIFLNDLKNAKKILTKYTSFWCEMMKLFILQKSNKNDEIMIVCDKLEKIYKTIEQQTYINFWRAEVYYDRKDTHKLKQIMPRLIGNLYFSNKRYIATRSFLIYNFYKLLEQEYKGYVFLEFLIKHKCYDILELDHKLKSFNILITKYGYKKTILIKESKKCETIEYYNKIKNNLKIFKEVKYED